MRSYDDAVARGVVDIGLALAGQRLPADIEAVGNAIGWVVLSVLAAVVGTIVFVQWRIQRTQAFRFAVRSVSACSCFPHLA